MNSLQAQKLKVCPKIFQRIRKLAEIPSRQISSMSIFRWLTPVDGNIYRDNPDISHKHVTRHPNFSLYEVLKFYLACRNQQLQPEGLNYALRATPTSTTGGEL